MYQEYLKKKLKKMDDARLGERLRQMIEMKESTKQSILESLTLTISGKDETFIKEIKEGLMELMKKVDNYNLERIEKEYEVGIQELERRECSIKEIIDISLGRTGQKDISIHIHNEKTGETIVTDRYLELQQTIEDLYLSMRLTKRLKKEGMKTLEDVIKRRKSHDEENFGGIEGIGRKSYQELKRYLTYYKLI